MSSQETDYVGASSQGFNPFPDKDTRDAETRAIRDEVNKNYDVLQDILDTLDEQIALYSSVDTVPDAVLTKPEEFMHVVAANKITRQNLLNVKESIRGLIEISKK